MNIKWFVLIFTITLLSCSKSDESMVNTDDSNEEELDFTVNVNPAYLYDPVLLTVYLLDSNNEIVDEERIEEAVNVTLSANNTGEPFTLIFHYQRKEPTAFEEYSVYAMLDIENGISINVNENYYYPPRGEPFKLKISDMGPLPIDIVSRDYSIGSKNYSNENGGTVNFDFLGVVDVNAGKYLAIQNATEDFVRYYWNASPSINVFEEMSYTDLPVLENHRTISFPKNSNAIGLNLKGYVDGDVDKIWNQVGYELI